MNNKTYKSIQQQIEEYSKEIRTRKGHLSNSEKQKLLAKARKLMDQ